LPDGSRPTRCHNASPTACRPIVSEKTFDTLWMENDTSQSPAPASTPSTVCSAMPKLIGRHARQRGDVGRDVALLARVRVQGDGDVVDDGSEVQAAPQASAVDGAAATSVPAAGRNPAIVCARVMSLAATATAGIVSP
jgi:hypothetical protein